MKNRTMKNKMKNKISLLGILLLMFLPLAQAGTLTAPEKAKPNERIIRITALDIRFDKTQLSVRAGETVRFIVTNKGRLTHEFTIGDAKEQAEHEKEMQRMSGMAMPDEPNAITLKSGETKSLIWTFGSKPVVEFACHVPGHYAAGMVGKIFVKT
jgi:uncharacterized cupredoxin-like copper-binding protein